MLITMITDIWMYNAAGDVFFKHLLHEKNITVEETIICGESAKFSFLKIKSLKNDAKNNLNIF